MNKDTKTGLKHKEVVDFQKEFCSGYLKKHVINKLLNDEQTKTDWKKSRKSFNDDDFYNYCNDVYGSSSIEDIKSFMDN